MKNPTELGKHVYISPRAKKSLRWPNPGTDSPGIWSVTILRKQSLVVQHCHLLKTLYLMLLVLLKQTQVLPLDHCQLWVWADTISLAVSRPCLSPFQSPNTYDPNESYRIYFSRGNTLYTPEVQWRQRICLTHIFYLLEYICILSERKMWGRKEIT